MTVVYIQGEELEQEAAGMVVFVDQVRNKLDRIAIDILGELPETDNGNKYIVVVSDPCD